MMEKTASYRHMSGFKAFASIYIKYESFVQADMGLDVSQSLIFLHIKVSFLTLTQASPVFLCICSTSLLETLSKKKKLLVMSNFSFFHSVFY